MIHFFRSICGGGKEYWSWKTEVNIEVLLVNKKLSVWQSIMIFYFLHFIPQKDIQYFSDILVWSNGFGLMLNLSLHPENKFGLSKKVETKGEARSQTHNKILIRWFSVDVTTKAQIMLKRVKIAQNAKSKFWPENQLKKHKNMVHKKVAKLQLNMMHLSLKTKKN